MSELEFEKPKPTVNADKLKALQAAMNKLEKKFCKVSLMQLGEEHIDAIEVILPETI